MVSNTKKTLSWLVNIALILMLANAGWNYYQLSQSTKHLENRSVLQSAGLVKDLSGNSFDLNSLSGKPAVLIFWATWCAPCSLELSRVKNAVASGEVDPKSVYAVSIGEERSVVLNAVKERGYNFEVLLDEEATLAQSLRISSTPTVVFIDKDLRVKDAHAGISPFLISNIKSHL